MLPKEKSTFLKLIRKTKLYADSRKLSAEEVINEVLENWKSNAFPELPNETKIKEHSNSPEIKEISNWILEQEFLDASFWLSTAYSILIGTDERSAAAMYFTPPKLAENIIMKMIRQGANLHDQSWYDPASGGAAFLTPLSKMIAKELTLSGASDKEIIEKISRQLSGNEKDSYLLHLSENFIRMSLYEKIVKSGKIPKVKISNDDGLLINSKKHDNIICNPPYFKLKKEQATIYTPCYSSILEGQPNIYALFIEQCIRSCKDSGTIGLVTPTSFFSGKYFSKLRESICKNSHPRSIGIVQNRQGIFVDVQQETAVSIIRKSNKDRRKTEIWSQEKGKPFLLIGSTNLANDGAPWVIPRNKEQSQAAKLREKFSSNLESYGYRMKVGAYVHYRDKRKTYKNRPSRSEKITLPLIWPSNIVAKKRIKIDTKEDPKKITRPLFIEVDNEDHPSIIRDPFVALQRVTSSDQKRRLISSYCNSKQIKNTGPFFGENHVIFLIKGPKAVLTPKEMAEILYSEEIDFMFRSLSGSVNVSTYELSHLPLPNPNDLKERIKKYGGVHLAMKSYKKE